MCLTKLLSRVCTAAGSAVSRLSLEGGSRPPFETPGIYETLTSLGREKAHTSIKSSRPSAPVSPEALERRIAEEVPTIQS